MCGKSWWSCQSAGPYSCATQLNSRGRGRVLVALVAWSRDVGREKWEGKGWWTVPGCPQLLLLATPKRKEALPSSLNIAPAKPLLPMFDLFALFALDFFFINGSGLRDGEQARGRRE
jgi:hypothetical protein